MAADSGTRGTLLERLRDGEDPLAWGEFFERYWRPAYAFARRSGCSDQTAQDVVQELMLTVFQQREVFRYDRARGRFRNWLCTVVRQKVAALRRDQGHQVRPAGGTEGAAALQAVPADAAPPDAAWDELFERGLLAALLDAVRREVEPQTYQAFELTALHGLSGDDAAAATGLTRNAVYLARKRVLTRLQELGAPYRLEGELHERVREALEMSPEPAVERALATRVESTLALARGLVP